MSVVAEHTDVSAEDFLAMPDWKLYELIDGNLVERKISALSSWVGLTLASLIRVYIERDQLGWVFGPDNGIQCFPGRPKLVRFPDVTFIKSERMTWDEISDGWMRIVPDLIVEVVSPNDLAYEVAEKVELFAKAGVPLLWIVYPNVRTIRVVRGDGTTSILDEGDELSGERVIPGFVCPVASIFPPRPTAPAAEAPAGV